MPETRDTARKAWGLEIISMWGCVEVGHIGIECDAHQGMHMSDDLVITEFVDYDDSRQATPRPSIAFWNAYAVWGWSTTRLLFVIGWIIERSFDPRAKRRSNRSCGAKASIAKSSRLC